jgi:hypothetical protein
MAEIIGIPNYTPCICCGRYYLEPAALHRMKIWKCPSSVHSGIFNLLSSEVNLPIIPSCNFVELTGKTYQLPNNNLSALQGITA